MNIDLNRVQHMVRWLSEKIKLDAFAPRAKDRRVYRGQVYWCNFGYGVGDEIQKERPAVIIQNNTGNSFSGNTIVVPVTHTRSPLPTVVELQPIKNDSGEIILDGSVSASNIMSFSKARLGDYICELTDSEMKKIDKSIAASLGIFGYYEKVKNSLTDKTNTIEDLRARLIQYEQETDDLKQEIDDLKQQMIDNNR